MLGTEIASSCLHTRVTVGNVTIYQCSSRSRIWFDIKRVFAKIIMLHRGEEWWIILDVKKKEIGRPMNGNVHYPSLRLDRDSKNPKVMVGKWFTFLQSKGTVPSLWSIHHTSISDSSQTVERKLFSIPVRRHSTLVLKMLTKRISVFGQYTF